MASEIERSDEDARCETPLEQGELILSESPDEFTLPEGTTYHLNSKKLRVKQLRRIAEALNLPSTTSVEDMRRMIEGKLQELDREPTTMQVIVQSV